MGAFLATLAASILGMKYQSNIANDPKAAIGSGTSPTMNPGDGGQFNPVAGSEVKDFTEFSFEDPSSPNTEGGSEEEQLLQMLMEAGMTPEDLQGIPGLAFGGPLKRAGGGITSLFGLEMTMPDLADIMENSLVPFQETVQEIGLPDIALPDNP